VRRDCSLLFFSSCPFFITRPPANGRRVMPTLERLLLGA
jgi:hypothetical protein